MRKFLLVLLMIVLVSGLIFGGCTKEAPPPTPAPPTPAPPTPAPPAPETVKLRFCHVFPSVGFYQEVQFPRYFKIIEEATGGKYVFDIEYFPVGTILGGSEAYDGVINGIVDAASIPVAYTPGRFPVIMTLSQSGVAPAKNCDAAVRTIWEFYEKFKPVEFDEVKILHFYATGPGWIMSNTPITTVDQMKGMKIRVSGSGSLGVQAIGAEPIAMPMGDVYMSAQKNIIEATVEPISCLEMWKHAEVFDYSTYMGYLYSEYFWTAMNLDTWNSLPKDLQEAFDAVASDACNDAGAVWQYYEKHGMEFAAASPGGHEYIYLSDAEVAKLKGMLASVGDQYIAEMNAKGLPGEELVNEAAKIMEKYNKLEYEPFAP